MPWKESSPMDQKTQFIADYLRQTLSFTGLCALHHVSRKTGHRWVTRPEEEGPAGLALHSVTAPVPRTAASARMPRAL